MGYTFNASNQMFHPNSLTTPDRSLCSPKRCSVWYSRASQSKNDQRQRDNANETTQDETDPGRNASRTKRIEDEKHRGRNAFRTKRIQDERDSVAGYMASNSAANGSFSTSLFQKASSTGPPTRSSVPLRNFRIGSTPLVFSRSCRFVFSGSSIPNVSNATAEIRSTLFRPSYCRNAFEKTESLFSRLAFVRAGPVPLAPRRCNNGCSLGELLGEGSRDSGAELAFDMILDENQSKV